MTIGGRHVDWPALGAAMGSAVLFTLLLSSPFLWGAGIRHWLLGLAVGVALGRVLRDAGLVGVRADAQRRLYALRPQPPWPRSTGGCGLSSALERAPRRPRAAPGPVGGGAP
jgi:hypothetical protein